MDEVLHNKKRRVLQHQDNTHLCALLSLCAQFHRGHHKAFDEVSDKVGDKLGDNLVRMT